MGISWEQLSSFVVVSVTLNLTPGADVMTTMAVGLKHGAKHAFLVAVGVSMGILAHTLMVCFGLGLLLARYPTAQTVIQYCGVLYLAHLGFQTLKSRSSPEEGGPILGPLQCVRIGFVTNLLNPKVALFILFFLQAFISPDGGEVAQRLILGSTFALTSLVVTGAYGLFATAMSGPLRRYGHLLNRLAAIVFFGLAAWLAST